jgi:hypothetical protein
VGRWQWVRARHLEGGFAGLTGDAIFFFFFLDMIPMDDQGLVNIGLTHNVAHH